jgi:hypothetical protein
MDDRLWHRSPKRQHLAISKARSLWRGEAAGKLQSQKTDYPAVVHSRSICRTALSDSPQRLGRIPGGNS